MTTSEAHDSKDYMRSPEAHAKRMALPLAERRRLYTAHRQGDWSTVMEIMGEDVGRD